MRPASIVQPDNQTPIAVIFEKFTNSLWVAAVNVALAAVAFVLFVFPRFTNVGGKLCLLILLLVIIDVVLVLRDLFRSGTRGRAIVAVLLWLPILFLFAMKSLVYELTNIWKGCRSGT